MSRSVAFFAGASLGLLLGVLAGLAASPVVGTVIGALVALLGAILGLKEETPTGGNENGQADVRRFGVIGLGVACTIALFIGVLLRTHDTLGLSPAQQVARWRAAGYDTTEARQLVALTVAGLVPKGATVQAPSDQSKTRSTILFAGSAEACDRADPSRLGDVTSLRAGFSANAGAWREFSARLDSVPERARLSLLRSAHAMACP